MRDHARRTVAALLVLTLCGCDSVTPSPAPTEAPTAGTVPTDTPPAASPIPPAPSTTTPPQPTVVPGSPLPNTGDVIFRDDFSGSTRYLAEGGDGNDRGEYVDGVYRVSGNRRESLPYFGSGGTTSACASADCDEPTEAHDDLASVVVEVEAKQTSGSLDGAFGIACNYRSGGLRSSFVSLTISGDGRRHAIGMYQPLAGHGLGAVPFDVILGGVGRGDPHPAIATGLGATNRLRAECATDSFRLFANDELVAQGVLDLEVANTSDQVGIGLIAGFSPSTRVEAEFDNLVVSELTEAPSVGPSQGEYFSDPLREANGTWLTGTVFNTEWFFTGDAYRAEGFSEQGGDAWVTPLAMLPPDDMSMAVDVVFVDVAIAGMAGFLCRSNGVSGYGFHLTTEGEYLILRLDDADELPVILAGPTPHSAIRSGIGETNRMRFDCVGDTLTAYANGVLLEQVTDSTYDERGNALYVVAFGLITVDLANYSESYAPLE